MLQNIKSSIRFEAVSAVTCIWLKGSLLLFSNILVQTLNVMQMVLKQLAKSMLFPILKKETLQKKSPI